MPANNKSELILSKWFWAKLAAYHSMIISPFAVIVYYTYGIDNYLIIMGTLILGQCLSHIVKFLLKIF